MTSGSHRIFSKPYNLWLWYYINICSVIWWYIWSIMVGGRRARGLLKWVTSWWNELLLRICILWSVCLLLILGCKSWPWRVVIGGWWNLRCWKCHGSLNIQNQVKTEIYMYIFPNYKDLPAFQLYLVYQKPTSYTHKLHLVHSSFIFLSKSWEIEIKLKGTILVSWNQRSGQRGEPNEICNVQCGSYYISFVSSFLNTVCMNEETLCFNLFYWNSTSSWDQEI